MEEWKINCITSNLDKLIHTTICDAYLLAHLAGLNILSCEDKQIIDAERESSRKAAKLYDILLTRKNGISSLTGGLRYCHQSGALHILISSFLEQDVKKVLSTSYTFHNWKSLLASIPDSILQKIVQLHREEYIETFLFFENQTEFAIDTIPNCPPYYVPRFISNRLRLALNILELDFSDGNSEELRDFLDENKNQDMCFVSEDEFIQNIESDDQYTSKGYYICDSPGCGKTWLLASLARIMRTKYSDRIIVFQRLSEIDFFTDPIGDSVHCLLSNICPNPLVTSLIKAAVNENSIKMEIFLDGFDEVDDIHMQAAKRFLSSLKASSENVRFFVTSRPHMEHELEPTLGVVAYDIRPFDRQNQLDFLEQFWITSISSGMYMSRLKALAKACQTKLQSCLSSQDKDILGIPIQCYMLAEIFLNSAKVYCNNLKTELNQVLELHFSFSNFETYKHYVTLMLYKRSSKTNQDEKRAKSFHVWKALEIFSSKLAALYKQVMLPDEEFSDLEYLSYGILEDVKIDNRLQISFVDHEFAEYLVAEFISEILTGMQNSQKNFCKLRSCVMEFVGNEVFQVGFCDCSYSFRLKCSPMYNEGWPTPQIYCDRLKSTVIPFFLNEHLGLAFSSDLRNVAGSKALLEFLRPNQFFQILINCVQYEWIYLIKFFTSLLQSCKENPEVALLYKSILLGSETGGGTSVERPLLLLCLVAKHSNISALKHCIQFYEKCLDYNIIDAIKRTPVWLKTPYHEALEQGGYEMVEYFMQFELPFGNRWLLPQCISDSYAEDACKTHAKIDILTLELNYNAHLIWDMDHAGVHGPLVKYLLATPGINLKIIKYLLANIQENMQTCYPAVPAALDFETIKNASRSMNKYDLRELCRIFFEELNVARTANTKQQLLDALKSMLERKDLGAQTIQMVLKQISPAELFKLSSTLLYHGTLGNQSTTTFDLLVKQGVNLFAEDKHGFSVIHYAAKFGNQNIFRYLVTKGFCVNQQTGPGITPLMVSAENHPEMLLFLLQNGATVNLEDQKGETFLHKFALKLQNDKQEISSDNFHDLVKFLLNQPDTMKILKSKRWMQSWEEMEERTYLWENLNKICKKSTLLLLYEKLKHDINYFKIGLSENYVLLKAIERKMSLDFIEGFFECGANINISNKQRQNALHLAATFGSWQTLAYILKKSSLPINGTDDKGNTPLHLTCGWGYCHWKSAKILLEHGADPYKQNHNKETFIEHAVRYTSESKFCELLRLLQKLTNDPNILSTQMHNGQTLLHVRLRNTEYNLDNFTLNQIKHNPNIDVNLADNFGNTIFLLLAKSGKHWDLVKTLAENKAWITCKNNEGYGVLHYAAKNGNLEMVKYFHSLGLPLDDKTKDGNSPIFLACRHLPAIKYLYAKGCNISEVNKEGQTLLYKAAVLIEEEDTFIDLVLFLIKHKITKLIVQRDYHSRRTAIHQFLKPNSNGFFCQRSLPGFLMKYIVSLPEYDISVPDDEGDTLFTTAFEKFYTLETSAIDAIYDAYSKSVDPETLNHAVRTELNNSVCRKNPNAVRYLLEKNDTPNQKVINCFIPIENVLKKLNNDKNRAGYTFLQFNSILKEFLWYLLRNKNLLCATDSHASTFLHKVAEYCHPEDFQLIVTEICEKGFTEIFYMKNSEAETPVIIAVRNDKLTDITRRILDQNGIFTNSDLDVDSDWNVFLKSTFDQAALR